MKEVKSEAIYRVVYLMEDAAMNRSREKNVLMSGRILAQWLNDKELSQQIIKIAPEPIEEARFYQISSMQHPVGYSRADERLIFTGNYEILVSGKGLLELAQEDTISFIGDRPIFGNTYLEIKDGILALIEGQAYWGITGGSIDFKKSLLRLEKECARLKK